MNVFAHGWCYWQSIIHSGGLDHAHTNNTSYPPAQARLARGCIEVAIASNLSADQAKQWETAVKEKLGKPEKAMGVASAQSAVITCNIFDHVKFVRMLEEGYVKLGLPVGAMCIFMDPPSELYEDTYDQPPTILELGGLVAYLADKVCFNTSLSVMP